MPAEPAVPYDAVPADVAAPVTDLRRVLVVVAHPDDETLTAGGLLAALAEVAEVTLVTCTRGERGDVLGDELVALRTDRAALAQHRTDELQRAVAALGIQHQVFLDTVDGGTRLVDSGMAWQDGATYVRATAATGAGPDAFSVADMERSVAALTGVINDLRPDLVIVDEPGGGYGHPDHVRAHEITMAAVARAATQPLVAWPVRPASQVRLAQQRLTQQFGLPAAGTDGQVLTMPDPDGPQPSMVVADDMVDVTVDLGPMVDNVIAAMAAHASQVHPPVPTTDPQIGAVYALSNGVRVPLLRQAWLQSAPGTDRAVLRDAVSTALERGTSGAAVVAEQSAAAGFNAPRPVEEEPRWFRPAMLVFAVVLGVFMASVGTTFHRTWMPYGLIVALVGVVAGGVLARSFVDRLGHLLYAIVVVVTVFAMTYIRPGGDVLVTNEPIGLAWLGGSMLCATVLPAVVPKRAFADR